MEHNPHLGQYGRPVYLTLCTTATAEDLEWLAARKKEWGLQRERLMASQKQAAQVKDYEAAKALKPAIAELMQLHRAAALFLGHLAANPPGDSPYKPLKNWGVELAEACRAVDSMFLYSQRKETFDV